MGNEKITKKYNNIRARKEWEDDVWSHRRKK